MENENLLTVLDADEMKHILGGGYWIVKEVNGVKTVFWVNDEKTVSEE